MKKHAIFLMTAVMALMMAFVACKKDKNDSNSSGGKLSPPSWIRGVWEHRDADGYISFEFTSNDIVETIDYYGSDMDVIVLTFSSVNRPNTGMSADETIKTDSVYEVTITQQYAPDDYSNVVCHFKKGDGSYIDFDENVSGISSRLNKK